MLGRSQGVVLGCHCCVSPNPDVASATVSFGSYRTGRDASCKDAVGGHIDEAVGAADVSAVRSSTEPIQNRLDHLSVHASAEVSGALRTLPRKGSCERKARSFGIHLDKLVEEWSFRPEAAQREVFAFDWGSVPDLAPDEDRLPIGRDLWLTSFWGFDPASWGCIGFADEAKRNRYLRLSSPNALVAVYVTKGKGPEQMRGKVVGVLEVSHNAGHASQFIAGDRWAEKEVDPASRGKWLYAVQATRAWRVVQEDWKPVEQLFPAAYASAHAEYIGSSGVQVSTAEAELLLQLDVYEVPVYGQVSRVNGTIQTLESALSPSRAIPPATEPYWVGETDGPKHLYILELSGDTSAYLGRSPAEVDGRCRTALNCETPCV